MINRIENRSASRSSWFAIIVGAVLFANFIAAIGIAPMPSRKVVFFKLFDDGRDSTCINDRESISNKLTYFFYTNRFSKG